MRRDHNSCLSSGQQRLFALHCFNRFRCGGMSSSLSLENSTTDVKKRQEALSSGLEGLLGKVQFTKEILDWNSEDAKICAKKRISSVIETQRVIAAKITERSSDLKSKHKTAVEKSLVDLIDLKHSNQGRYSTGGLFDSGQLRSMQEDRDLEKLTRDHAHLDYALRSGSFLKVRTNSLKHTDLTLHLATNTPTVGNSVFFQIACSKSDVSFTNSIDCRVFGGSGAQVDCSVDDYGVLMFIPLGFGDHTVEVQLYGQHITNSPFALVSTVTADSSSADVVVLSPSPVQKAKSNVFGAQLLEGVYERTMDQPGSSHGKGWILND